MNYSTIKGMKALHIIFLFAVAVLFAACSSTEDATTEKPSAPTGKKTYTMTINANKHGDTRVLTLDGNTLNSSWAQGEVVTVYNVTKSADLTGTLVAQGSGINTTLKGSLTGTIDNGDELKLKFLSPNYDSQTGTLEYIAANCDYAEATVIVANVEGGNITTAETASFTNQQAIVRFILKNSGGTSISASSLTVSNNTNSYTITPASATSEIYVAIPGFSNNIFTLTASVGGSTYDYAKSEVTFENSSFYSINVKLSECIDMASVTTDHAGKVIGADGKVYSHVRCATAAGTTASAMIGYVGNRNGAYGSAYSSEYNHGLAISLSNVKQNGDEGSEKMGPASAKTAASSYKRTRPSNCSAWFLASKTQWSNIISTFGYAVLRDKFGTVGGSNLYSGSYWSSTDGTQDSSNTWSYSFHDNSHKWSEGRSDQTAYVRSFFAF